jgi:hypothetical protein
MSKLKPESPSIQEVREQIINAKTLKEEKTKIQKLQQLLDKLIQDV